jgi:hypothetical protein
MAFSQNDPSMKPPFWSAVRLTMGQFPDQKQAAEKRHIRTKKIKDFLKTGRNPACSIRGSR